MLRQCIWSGRDCFLGACSAGDLDRADDATAKRLRLQRQQVNGVQLAHIQGGLALMEDAATVRTGAVVRRPNPRQHYAELAAAGAKPTRLVVDPEPQEIGAAFRE